MPNQYVNKVVQSNGTTLIDISDTTAIAADVASGKYFYLASGEKVAGTSSGSGTEHTIYFEFSDGTDTTLVGYWDSSFISDAILATTPNTYGQKTVTLAQLDGVTWYEYDPSEPYETVYDDVTSMYVDGDARYFWLTSLANVTIPLGSAWRITLDSTVYSLVGASHYVEGVGVTVVLGNPKWLGYEDDNTGVPFCFYNYNNNALCGDTELPAGNYSLKIEHRVTA